MDTNIPKHTTVLIIGGGPAGALSASFLVQEGIDVVVCEKEKFPRYHIGESMLPSLLPILEFLGIRETVDNYGFIKKYGAHWKIKQNLPDAHTDFRKQPKYKYSYQVVRSEFDELILNCAEEKGAKVFQQTVIKDVIFEGDKPVSAVWERADKSTGSISFDYLIDASGLSGLLSNRYLKNRKFQPAFANIALCRYWKNFKHYTDQQGKEYPGEFLMHAIADGSGWIWAIPLHNGTISIGVVIPEAHYKQLQSQNVSMDEIYNSKLELAYGIKDILVNAATEGETKYWNDYSYFAEQFAGDNYRLVGDAAAFLDPLLSSGLHIASIGALSAAATLCSIIKGDCSPKEAAKFHDVYIRSSYTRFMLLLSAIYRQITNQEQVVLQGISGESIQSVFDIIQPMLTGNYDMKKDQPMQEQKADKIIDYMQSRFAESYASDKDTSAPNAGEKSIAAVFSEKDLVIDSSNAINGYFINLEKGKLGLQKVK